jgi:amidase
LGALESPAPDPNDPATKTCTPPPGRDYTRFLKPDGLKGARIGIPRAFFYDNVTPPSRAGEEVKDREGEAAARTGAPSGGPSTTPSGAPFGRGAGFGARGGGLTPEQAQAMTEAIDILKQQGAIIVDPVEIPSVSTKDPDKSFLLWGQCSGQNNTKGRDANCSVVLKYGMKRDFNAWLKTLGPSAPVKTLTELREWNITHIQAGAIRYGQSNLDISDEMNVEVDRARYEADRARDIEVGGTQGIDAAMKANNLDALLFPGASGAAIAAKPGYPTVLVPFATVPNALTPPTPPGFDPKPTPFGVAFTGMACSEPKLLQLGYAFEQSSKRRVPPASTP